jgi:hypothetical protein
MSPGLYGMNARSRSDTLIYLVAGLLSLLLTYDGSLRASVINPDGICYLQSAATFGSANWHEALHVCGQAQWPFYSLLIYGLSALTHISFVSAAFVLNGVFSLISVLAFIYLVKLLNGNKQVLWFAAIAILLMHEFNSVREYVIRDHGFWAFYLVSVVALIRYLRAPLVRDALFWNVSLLLATLFRVEGVLFLLLMPFVVFVNDGARLRQFLQLNLLTIIGGGIALLYVVMTRHPEHDVSRFSELQFQLSHGLQIISQNFHDKSAALAQAVLNDYSQRDAGMILGLMLLVWYGISIVTNLSIIYAIVAAYAFSQKLVKLDKPAKTAITGYVLINILITAPFLVEYMFLSKRYLIALSLLLLLWVPFGFAAIWERRSRLTILTAGVVLVSALGGIIDFGYSKSYIRDAGLWLAQNAPASAEIYSNDFQVMYYSDHFGNSIFTKKDAYADLNTLADGKWKQYDYLAVHITKQALPTTQVIQAMHLTPTKIFANRRGDAIVIYEKQQRENKL